ncbi:hypothetical protein BC938DRAFT_474551 [Jimgerdemannia flammicorona]|uniref:Fe2OG dioxygenase domain-containing protein n=1 Tax=Jimgerdemannia flammicorona TaxID=994334 RepID=A0A433QSE1_9FUNG|nr:hypothetical protein BC938DRAFT_474551 [Jimgerdemannia flammicorona]
MFYPSRNITEAKNTQDWRGDNNKRAFLGSATFMEDPCGIAHRPMHAVALSLEEVKVVRYLSMDDKPAEHVLGVGPHKDYSFLTILMQDDDVGGLQVQTADGKWIVRCNSNPNTFIVNIGEAFERLIQCCYVATTHRILNNTTGRDRISIPIFFNPATDAQIPHVRIPNYILRQVPANVLLQDPIYGISAFKGLARSHMNEFERWYATGEDGIVKRREV